MIGLEYICGLYNKSHSSLARELGINSRQTINMWIKEKRGIAKKYLPRLVEIFNIPEEYFQKELSDLDKLQIQRIKLDNETTEHTFVDELFDPETGRAALDENGEVLMVEQHYMDIGEQFYRESLDYQMHEAKVIRRLKETLIRDLKEVETEYWNDLIKHSYDTLKYYEMLIDILEKGISRNTIFGVLKAVKNYQDNEFNKDGDGFSDKISLLIKEEEDRLKEQTKKWRKMTKDADEIFGGK